MFRLKRVEILGFKSFYDKVDLTFPGSVTAVVGPNGCGKSNICDAVAWALGEQSAKILRGDRMDDVIFNGSARRRPLGMAEVTLTLTALGNGNGNGSHGETDEKGAADVASGHAEAASGEPRDLRIGRRVYREGHGEYFLNDKQVRLKDIQDELLGTGLGVRLYSVIEQGRIDQVLSTKPQDRRRLIEEAAGITRYKLKKRLAETKLEETKGNLLRLSDIISEIERNCASLKRQASRAARYKEKTEALKTRKASIARARYDRLLAASSSAKRIRDEKRDAEAQAAASLARAEADLASSRLSESEATGTRDRLREKAATLEAAIERDDALLEANRRSLAELEARLEALTQEGREFSAEKAAAARELLEAEERLQRAVAEARSRSLAREESDQRASEAAAALSSLEKELETARAAALSAAGDRVTARNARHEVDVDASRVAASLGRLLEARARVSAELAQRDEEISRARVEEEKLSAESRNVQAEVEAWDAELARLSQALIESEAARDQAREALLGLEHRLGALQEIERSREGNAAEAGAALSAAGMAPGGTLSRRLRPAAGWEGAVDLLLGEDLEALLASGDAARAVEASSGLPASRLIRADWEGDPPAAAPSDSLGGWEIALANFAELSPAERAALPAAAFVESLTRAFELSERHPATAFATPRRELVRGSLVRVVRTPAEAAGPFTLEREVAALRSEAARGRDSLAAFERSLSDLKRSRADRESEATHLRARQSEASARLSGFFARYEERLAERGRLAREGATLGAEAEILSREGEQLHARRARLEEEEQRQAGRELEARAAADGLAAGLSEARPLAMAASEELAHRRTEAEVAAERRRSAEASRQKLIESAGSLERRAADAVEEGRRLADRRQELVEEESRTRARRAASVTGRDENRGALAAAAAVAAETTARVAAAEETTRSLRASLDGAREARFEAEMEETRVRAELTHVENQANEDFGKPPGELPPPEDASEEGLAALEAEAKDLEAAIERLGPVNVLAFEEYSEESRRLEFLTVQRDDLVASIEDLQDSIRKINATSSARFQDAFTAINQNFAAMFSRLFQGGAAEMRLLDENDLLESGVEIVAQPPGKRNQSIQLLSGGEKALTAIALLMAIFRYKPSPFCILDEVDAPLDEANIDRFTRLLREMTEDTQFIAITHNKRTMETADVMYGVTMEEPGCSKIVSVKFD
jgi:chromosome segregation protein